jgi:nicotinamidase/pyrazinamidase
MKALLVVDVQYDFMPGGALAVPHGDTVVAPILAMRDVSKFVVFTQDWHPRNHCSFRENGGIWPVHCVQNAAGARIDTRLPRPDDIVIRKGMHQDVDSYSGFWDNERRHRTDLDRTLTDNRAETLYVCGLATDYCVKFTALDAAEAGYRVFLVADACQGVEVNHGDVGRAIDEMRAHGVEVIDHRTVLGQLLA